MTISDPDAWVLKGAAMFCQLPYWFYKILMIKNFLIKKLYFFSNNHDKF